MTELIIKAFIFLAIAISVPFAAGLAFACAAFSVISAVSVRRTGNKRRKDKREIDLISGFTSVKADIADIADIADCEDCDVAACSVRSPREVPPLYDDETAEDREEKRDSLKAIFNDVMRLINETENEARLSTVKRAIATAKTRKE